MVSLFFQIEYQVHEGQQVYLCGSIPELGNLDETKAVLMQNDNHVWHYACETGTKGALSYYYFIREDKCNVRTEWGKHRTFSIEQEACFIFHDHWKERPFHQYLYSSVFTDSIFHHKITKNEKTKYYKRTILLNVICPYVQRNEQVCIIGENETLGNWQVEKAIPLSHISQSEWQIVLNADDFIKDTAYKFVIINPKKKENLHWEEGENRTLRINRNRKEKSVTAETSLTYRYPNFQFKGAGTAIPVFSLRSDQSFGIGDFFDLKKMIDWAALTHQQLIQVLPINDTTTCKDWRDSYPYSAISIYALHPIYLGCTQFPLKDKPKYKRYLKQAETLNKLPELDYEKALKLKTQYTQDLFEQEEKEVLRSRKYKSFCKKNEVWLFPYSCYCYLRDKFNTADFSQWGEYANYNKAGLQQMIQNDTMAKKALRYHSFVQFLLHTQLSEIKKYAHKMGVGLKGDIPIGINRDSVEAWTEAHLFNMDTQTGAPPDDFSVHGQNWGFPTYNWRTMRKDNYQWWKNRFHKISDYFDAYRIDHILGFFRIWEIPLDAVQGTLGHFSPALPYCKEELLQQGFSFDEKRMVKPFIDENFLYDTFGEYTDLVKQEYLEDIGNKQYQLKEHCNTQRKISLLFSEKRDKKNKKTEEGLYKLSANVLFVRDREDPGKFHPRITAQYTYSYRCLDEQSKEIFNRIYDDFFYHRHNYFWREQATQKLPELISSNNMLVCGEDLGMVPSCVPSVMKELQILSLEIQRMPKEPYTAFTRLKNIPYLSVCSPSTHDMSPIRLWWHENRDLTQKYYNEILGMEGKAPDECSADVCKKILELHTQSAAMWTIIPLQDWFSMDEAIRHPNPQEERINIPSNPQHYWRYRMHISLDDLLKQKNFNRSVKELTKRK